ncbi:MAG: divergent polysaccharide deacetylase family protein [Pseudomonadota bacterium]
MARLSKGEKLLAGAWAGFILLVASLSLWVVAGGPPPRPIANLADATPNRALEAAPAHDGEEAAALPPVAQDDEAPPPAVASDLSLAPVSEALSETTPRGALPRISDDGREPWRVYAAPAPPDDGRPRIAVMLTALGLNQAAGEAAIAKLPPAISFAFSPYGRDLPDWAHKARAKGHEIFLMVPMEPLRYPENDPGPQSLLRSLSPADNIARLNEVMTRFAGYVGIVNDMGSAFTANEAAMRPVLQELKNRGLMFIDARSTNYSVAASLAGQMAVPVAVNNRFIDETPSADEVRRMLLELETTAQTLGNAVGFARPLPLSIEAIATWSAGVGERGLSLVPVSAIANRQPVR